MISAHPSLEKLPAPESKESAATVKVLLDQLRKKRICSRISGEMAEKRKEKLIAVAEHLPAIASRILQKFQNWHRPKISIPATRILCCGWPRTCYHD